MKDYYTLLAVSSDASLTQIDASYRRLMSRHHPNARTSPQALERMRELNEAWRVLSDPLQRAAYDHARESGVTFQPPSPTPTLRNVPQGNLEFGARSRRSTGGTCLVGLAVALVLVFAVGILVWGLDEQLKFGEVFDRTMGEFTALLPTSEARQTETADEEPTATPDPRCRDGCETPPAGCVVKGDIEANGSRFFYLPNDFGYSEINVDLANGDRWFCASADAQGAGWQRKAPTETPTLPPPPEFFTTAISRRAVTVCGENVMLRRGPGEEFPPVQPVAKNARVSITGVNGAWNVVNTENGALYIRTDQLCAQPTRAPTKAPAANGGAAQATAAPPTAAPAPSDAPASAATANFKYGAPAPDVPTNGAKYWCSRELVLHWNFDTTQLQPNEFFLVESKLVEKDRWFALADWTKETRVMLNPNRGGGSCDTVWWSNTGVYEWRVSVVTGNKEMPTYLSPFSEQFRINYGQ